MTLKRRLQILEALGLTPLWQPRTTTKSSTSPFEHTTSSAPLSKATTSSFEQSTVVTSALNVSANAITSVVADRHRRIAQLDWPTLQQEVKQCRACHLCETRKNTVFGAGDPQADWLIIGEAPGAEEDRRGEAFVGQGGILLDNMLASIQRKRQQDVYIANVLKCRPPQNRNPKLEEIVQCQPLLLRQISLIQPQLILALGRFAAQTLLNSQESIARLRGKIHHYQGIPLIVSYHPAYLLRNPLDKAKAWEDLLFARATSTKLSPQPPSAQT